MNDSRLSNRREFLRLSAGGAIGTAIAAAIPPTAAAAPLAQFETAKPAPTAVVHTEVRFSEMRQTPVQLKEVDEVRVTTLLDNFVDLNLPTTEVAKRPPPTSDVFFKPMLKGEHGFAALLTIRKDDGVRRILLDTGSSLTGMVDNADVLGLDLSGLDAVVISHGHCDHTLGTAKLLGRLRRQVPFVAHPYALLEHRIVMPNVIVGMPQLSRRVLRGANIDLIEATEPTLLAGNTLLVSGEVARTTSFETGLPTNQVKLDGVWQPDPLVRDDQSVAVNLRGKGLVIVTGCAHAGIVNTIRYIQAITGVEPVYAVIGGLHLQNPLAIPPTVAAIQEMGPRWVVPTHCTGYVGVYEFQRAMPAAFVKNGVGTTLVL